MKYNELIDIAKRNQWTHSPSQVLHFIADRDNKRITIDAGFTLRDGGIMEYSVKVSENRSIVYAKHELTQEESYKVAKEYMENSPA